MKKLLTLMLTLAMVAGVFVKTAKPALTSIAQTFKVT